MNHNEIIQNLCRAGFPTFLVGGAVRDIFTGEEPSDFDIVTQATPDEIEAVFQGRKVDTVGKSFGVTIVEGVEVATFRVDQFPNGNGSKNCEPVFASSIHEDLSRRDLTINALALCSISGELIDNHNGLEDLRNSVIRFVGNPDERIAEDPNRIVRACRFVAKIQGSFDPDTLFALQRNAHLVGTHVDPERIGKEVLKAVQLEQPSLFFSALQLIGALQHVLPCLVPCVNHEHGQWHKETVWEHLLLAGDRVDSKFPVVRLAAFLHDVGKPVAFRNNNDGTFVGHEVAGAELVDAELRRLRFSNSVREQVVGLVRAHMWGSDLHDLSPKAIRRLRFRLSELNVSPSDWFRIRIADRSANLNKESFTLTELRERLAALKFRGVQELPVFNANALALKGGDIIRRFGLTPGPLVGRIQRHLVEFVVENGFEFNNEQALGVEIINFLKEEVNNA